MAPHGRRPWCDRNLLATTVLRCSPRGRLAAPATLPTASVPTDCNAGFTASAGLDTDAPSA
jgi:hypothetical protein